MCTRLDCHKHSPPPDLPHSEGKARVLPNELKKGQRITIHSVMFGQSLQAVGQSPTVHKWHT